MADDWTRGNVTLDSTSRSLVWPAIWSTLQRQQFSDAYNSLISGISGRSGWPGESLTNMHSLTFALSNPGFAGALASAVWRFHDWIKSPQGTVSDPAFSLHFGLHFGLKGSQASSLIGWMERRVYGLQSSQAPNMIYP
jgi:hypothetical protein